MHPKVTVLKQTAKIIDKDDYLKMLNLYEFSTKYAILNFVSLWGIKIYSHIFVEL